jgi:hypothetical protein
LFEYIEFCQNNRAVLSMLFFFFTVSQIFSDWTRLVDCSQNNVCMFSLSKNPFEIIPCSFGYFPVKILACTVHVTDGNTGFIYPYSPLFWNKLEILGYFCDKESRWKTSNPTISRIIKYFELLLLLFVKQYILLAKGFMNQ